MPKSPFTTNLKTIFSYRLNLLSNRQLFKTLTQFKFHVVGGLLSSLAYCLNHRALDFVDKQLLTTLHSTMVSELDQE